MLRGTKGSAMARFFEELDYHETAIGEIVLRRRKSPAVKDDWVYEVTIDNEMLMSSTVNASEIALASLALAGRESQPCDVLVGGLGLGYTAGAALECEHVRRVDVVELLAPVISWHERRLVPLADTLMDDPRCSIIADDFFQYVGRPDGTKYDAILLDIDHSPESWLHEHNADFYNPAGLQCLLNRLNPGGVFALWSAWEPADEFLIALRTVFSDLTSHPITFYNPHICESDTNWIVTAEDF